MKHAARLAALALSVACGDSAAPAETTGGGGESSPGGNGVGGESSLGGVGGGEPALGGMGGTPVAIPLALELEQPTFAIAVERASVPIVARVRGPSGALLRLEDERGTVDELVLERDVEEPESMTLMWPLRRGGSLVTLELSDGAQSLSTDIDLYGGKPVAGLIDRMLIVDQKKILDWGGGNPLPREWASDLEFTAIHARGSATFAIDTGGALHALDIASATSEAVDGAEDLIALALGDTHLVGLRSDGSVVTAGGNGLGQLGVVEASGGVEIVPGLADIVAVGATEASSFAVRADGAVLAWGANSRGELGLGDEDNAAHPVPATILTLSNIMQISGGRNHVLALRRDGVAFAWGSGASGQLGDGSSGILADESQPILVESPEALYDLAASSNSSFAITASGSLFAWGQNSLAQLGVGDTSQRTLPTASAMGAASAVAGAPVGGIALDATFAPFVWGSNASGQLGLPPPPKGPERSTVPIAVVLP